MITYICQEKMRYMSKVCWKLSLFVVQNEIQNIIGSNVGKGLM